MDELISKQALLNSFGLSEKTRKWDGDHSGYNTMMLYEIQDMIESAPSVNPQEPKWIPVSEMPICCGMYLVARKICECPDTESIIMTDVSWFDGTNTWHNDNRINHDRKYLTDVIAWMPLPKPYKPQERGEQNG